MQPLVDRTGPGRSLMRRLYGGVTRNGLLAVLGVAAVFSLDWNVLVVRDLLDHGVAAWLEAGLAELAVHALIGLTFLAGVAPVMALGPRHGWRRVLALALALTASGCVAALLRILYDRLMFPEAGPTALAQWMHLYFARLFVRFTPLALLFVLVVEFRRRAHESLAAMRRAETEGLVLDREMAAARLQVLQAQIEPHFLFNTLANVRRLCRTDAIAGREMLVNLMRYLEAALPRMRDEQSPLAQEAALIDAYLQVQKIRMGRRLSYAIDIPAALAARTVPPMMLLTLVENALKHGLGPLPEGGMIRLDARLDGDALVLRVADSGRGFGEGNSGTGTGLANVRSRLEAMFGARAGLELATNLPRGVTATLRLPAGGRVD